MDAGGGCSGNPCLAATAPNVLMPKPRPSTNLVPPKANWSFGFRLHIGAVNLKRAVQPQMDTDLRPVAEQTRLTREVNSFAASASVLICVYLWFHRFNCRI